MWLKQSRKCTYEQALSRFVDVTHSGGAKEFELVQMKVEPRQKRLLNKETYLKGAFLSVKGLSDFYKE